MAEFLGDSRRSHYCGTINESITGKEVAVAGWCSKQRDLGQLIFIDFRDRKGIDKLAFHDKQNRDLVVKEAGVTVLLLPQLCLRKQKNRPPASSKPLPAMIIVLT